MPIICHCCFPLESLLPPAQTDFPICYWSQGARAKRDSTGIVLFLINGDQATRKASARANRIIEAVGAGVDPASS